MERVAARGLISQYSAFLWRYSEVWRQFFTNLWSSGLDILTNDPVQSKVLTEIDPDECASKKINPSLTLAFCWSDEMGLEERSSRKKM
jgi:hypothetical protein